MENKYYRQTGKFSPVGALLMTLSTFGVGVVLFIIYLYIVGWCPIIYLNILAAAGISGLLGWICGKIIKVYKIRNTFVAVICCTIGFLGATYIKWAYYDYRDFYIDHNEAVEADISRMKKTNAFEYYDLGDWLEQNDDIEQIFYNLSSVKAKDYFSMIGVDKDNSSDNYGGKSIWEYYNYDKILGKTAEEAKSNFEDIKTNNAYDYAKTRDIIPEKMSFFRLLSEPGTILSDVKKINEVGRWHIGRHSYSSSGSEDNVNGILLWLVWLGEFGLLAVFMYYQVVGKSKEPFIESDNEWATYANLENICRFQDIAKTGSVKSNMEQNPYWILDYALSVGAPAGSYIGLQMWYNFDKTETYISLTQVSFNKEGKRMEKNLVKYLKVDKNFWYRLDQAFMSDGRIYMP